MTSSSNRGFGFSKAKSYLLVEHLNGVPVEYKNFTLQQFNKLKFTSAVWIALGIFKEDMSGVTDNMSQLFCSKDSITMVFLRGYYLECAIQNDVALKHKFEKYFAERKYRALHNRLYLGNRGRDIQYELLDDIEEAILSDAAPDLSIVSLGLDLDMGAKADEAKKDFSTALFGKVEFLDYLLLQVIPNETNAEDFQIIKNYRNKLDSLTFMSADYAPDLVAIIDSFVASVLDVNKPDHRNNFDEPDYTDAGTFCFSRSQFNSKILNPLLAAESVDPTVYQRVLAALETYVLEQEALPLLHPDSYLGRIAFHAEKFFAGYNNRRLFESVPYDTWFLISDICLKSLSELTKEGGQPDGLSEDASQSTALVRSPEESAPDLSLGALRDPRQWFFDQLTFEFYHSQLLQLREAISVLKKNAALFNDNAISAYLKRLKEKDNILVAHFRSSYYNGHHFKGNSFVGKTDKLFQLDLTKYHDPEYKIKIDGKTFIEKISELLEKNLKQTEKIVKDLRKKLGKPEEVDDDPVSEESLDEKAKTLKQIKNAMRLLQLQGKPASLTETQLASSYRRVAL